MQHAANVQSFDFIGDKLQHTPGPHLIGGSLTADIKQNASDSPGTILWLKRHLPGLSHARTRRHGHVWLGREAMKPARHMALAGRSLRAGLLVPRARHTARRTFYEDAVASGVNARYLENLYLQWKVNPAKLDTQWNDYFRALEAGTSTTSTGVVGSGGAGGLQNLIRAYQVRGHEAAELDPLGLHAWRKWTDKGLSPAVPELEPSFHGFSEADLEKTFQVSLANLNGEHTLQEILGTLRSTYSGSVGIEYMHIGDLKKVEWIRQRVEDPNFIPSDKNKLIKVYQELLKVDTLNNSSMFSTKLQSALAWTVVKLLLQVSTLPSRRLQLWA